MSGIHARIAPSSLFRTVECPGWVQLAEGLPVEPDGPEAEEGTAAHWVADEWANGNEVPYGTPIPAPGKYAVDHDMIHGAKLWAQTVGYGSVPAGMPVVSTRIHPTDCWGTPDRWLWDPIARLLHVPDYKYGFGVVEAEGNWQGVGYAAGLLEALNVMSDPDVRVNITIVQPRAYHKDGPVRTWKTDVGELRGWINIARSAAHEALPPHGSDESLARMLFESAGPTMRTGPHCLHCPVALNGKCGTLNAAVTEVTAWVGDINPVAMPIAALAVHAQILDDASVLLEAARTGVLAQIEALIRNGHAMPGWKLEPGRSNLQWSPFASIEAVQAAAGSIPVLKPPALITPTQAAKAGVDVSKLSNRPPAALKLVRDDGSEARRAFS